jgi:hypothetical protein
LSFVREACEGSATQWRVYVAFLLLLHQGLRRGEALLLPADFLKSERTPSGIKYWLNVHTRTAEALNVYFENYRGRQDRSFFLTGETEKIVR